MRNARRGLPKQPITLPCDETGDCPYDYSNAPERDVEGMPFAHRDPRSCPVYGHVCPEFMEDFGLTVEDLAIRARIHCWTMLAVMGGPQRVNMDPARYQEMRKECEETLRRYPRDKYPQYY